MPDSHESTPDRAPATARSRENNPYAPGLDEPDREFGNGGYRESVEDGLKPPTARSADDRRVAGRAARGLPALPQRKPQSRRGLLLSFILCVILPTALAAAYYYLIAADQYVSQFKFAVIESTPVLPGIPPSMTTTSPSAQMGGGSAAMTLMAGGAGSMMMPGANATMQNYVVTDYLLSRQIVEELQKKINIRALYDSAAAKDDLWARFDAKLPMERFVRYWNRMVTATYDPMTGVADVTIRAFTPQDALLIAESMVTLSEDLVNSIAKRPQVDSVRFAEGEVKRAEVRMERAREALKDYRLQEGVIDPTGALSTNIALVQALRSQLVQQQADLASLLSQQQNANSSVAQSMRARLAATKDQLDKMQKEVSKDREGNRILTELVGRYERLDLERQYAQGAVVAAQQALDQARANAAAQHLYLTPYVRPLLAESALYPKRAQSVLIAALSFFGIWMVGLMVKRSVAEHA
jgi:capsular polysaccharide transport system permease protein